EPTLAAYLPFCQLMSVFQLMSMLARSAHDAAFSMVLALVRQMIETVGQQECLGFVSPEPPRFPRIVANRTLRGRLCCLVQPQSLHLLVAQDATAPHSTEFWRGGAGCLAYG